MQEGAGQRDEEEEEDEGGRGGVERYSLCRVVKGDVRFAGARGVRKRRFEGVGEVVDDGAEDLVWGHIGSLGHWHLRRWWTVAGGRLSERRRQNRIVEE